MADMLPEISQALSRIPSGCAILTVRTDMNRTGMLASWVQQSSFEPPMISVGVKKGRPIEKLIEEADGFVINVLGEQPGQMFKHFGRGFEPDEEAFSGLATQDIAHGVVIPDQVGWMDCRLDGRYTAGDHHIYFGVVQDAEVPERLLEPYVHVRKAGASY